MKTCLCICTCDRPVMLERLLSSLREMALDEARFGSVEIVLVDNDPDGRARKICAKIAEDLPVALHFVEEPERGLSFARNHAIDEALARGADFVAFIDDDDVPESDWLIQLLETQRASGADIVYGIWETMRHAHLPRWVDRLWMFRPTARNLHRKNIHGVPVLAGTCNVLLGRGILEKMRASGGAFSSEFATIGGEEMDFFIRAEKLGATTALSAGSKVNRDHEAERLTFKGLLRRHFHNGHVQMILVMKHCDAREIERSKRETREVLKRNLTGLLRHGLARSKKKSIKKIMGISYALGRMHGARGGSFDYYK